MNEKGPETLKIYGFAQLILSIIGSNIFISLVVISVLSYKDISYGVCFNLIIAFSISTAVSVILIVAA